jgi:anthranilate 1,2-dioxygenase (deaminating, decarboxylating) large subunit
MKRLYTLLPAMCLVLTAFLSTPAVAYVQSQPTINLGFTSFMDGGPPAGPGFYYTGYGLYYTADELVDHPVVPDADVDVWAYINQFIYQSDQPLLFGGKWGINFILPIVSFDSTPDLDNGCGVGDLWVGPFLQWDPIMGPNGPRFIHRIELQNIIPIGQYDNDAPLNAGSNFYSFNPYWAGTYWFTPRLTGSYRLHYLWNAKNSDPFIGVGGNDTQAGQAIHTNFSLGYELMPKQLRVGLNGYYLKQVTDTKLDGADVPGFKEQVLGLGPGAMWSFSQDTHLFFNAYFETSVENRPEGQKYILRLVHHF